MMQRSSENQSQHTIASNDESCCIYMIPNCSKAGFKTCKGGEKQDMILNRNLLIHILLT